MSTQYKTKFSFLAVVVFVLLASLALVNCGGGGGDDVAPTTTTSNTTASTYSVGGTVSGLAGSGLVLQNNGGDDLAVPANSTSFIFATNVADSGAYNVTVKTQPTTPDQVCVVGNSSGSVSGANVTTVTVSCSKYVPRFAYVANFNDNTVSSYTVDAVTGQLRHTGYAPTGLSPITVMVEPSGKFAYEG